MWIFRFTREDVSYVGKSRMDRQARWIKVGLVILLITAAIIHHFFFR